MRFFLFLIVSVPLLVQSAGCTLQGPLINVDLRPPAKVSCEHDEAAGDASLTDMVEDLVP